MADKHRKLVEELHKPARRNYPRRKFEVRGLDETWQADLVEMQSYARENRGVRYLLTIIDALSKFAWAVPVKRKTGNDVAAAMELVLRRGRVPTNLQTDQGKEFYNSSFKSLMSRYHINHYSTYSNLKASIVERFNRTLKNKMWLQFSLRGSYKWLDILTDLMAAYNASKHRTIGMKPNEVTAVIAETLLQQQKQQQTSSRNRSRLPKFRLGDKVRVSKNKHVFEKGYTPNWTTEIFKVWRVVASTVPVTYKLKDYQDKPIAGGFYEEELLRAEYPDMYLVERVLKKRGNKIYVKWLGFDSSHNSWINKTDL